VLQPLPHDGCVVVCVVDGSVGGAVVVSEDDGAGADSEVGAGVVGSADAGGVAFPSPTVDVAVSEAGSSEDGAETEFNAPIALLAP